MSDRMKDAEVAARDYGWRWSEVYGRRILHPPYDDPRHLWTAMWDRDGIPHWLPRFSEGEVTEYDKRI
jgi:hypothetical protein